MFVQAAFTSKSRVDSSPSTLSIPANPVMGSKEVCTGKGYAELFLGVHKEGSRSVSELV